MKALNRRIIKICSCLLLFIVFSFPHYASGSTVTLNPIADTDSQSDVPAGTNSKLHASKWCHLFIKFDVCDISEVALAKLKIYQEDIKEAYTLEVSATSDDLWSEGGPKPAKGNLITSVDVNGQPGYIEIDLTTYVRSKLKGNKIVSLTITTSLDSWTGFCSREASVNKPELILVTNIIPVTGVAVNPTNLLLQAGRTALLTATIEPEDALNKNISWNSSDTNIAVVSANGIVKGIAAGEAVITVTTEDGGKTAACRVRVTPPYAGNIASMTPGTNLWHIGWEGWPNVFRSGVTWSTTTDPWNPDFIRELIEARISCLRFMDWNQINHGCIQNWNQRIPKTANHYNQDNKLPCFTDNYDPGTNTHNLVWNGRYDYGVAYEWQIDLCNRVGADLWINIPVAASEDFQYQLAQLIKENLDQNLKVYVEWGNEIWNWGFTSTVYADQMARALGLQDVNVGAFCDPWRKYVMYASVRAFEKFEDVFGANSPRLVKVIAGQAGYHWPGYDYNHMVKGDLACLANSTINPNGITINAYAIAPYMGGQSISEQQNNISICAQQMQWAKNSLAGTNIALICYEGGADNYPDNGLVLTRNAAQEQLYIDYLTMLSEYCTGVFNQYTFYGGCWGLKHAAGEPAATNPKWRGWLSYWNGVFASDTISDEGNDQGNDGGSGGDSTSIINEVKYKDVVLYPNPVSSGNVLNIKIGRQVAETEGSLIIRDIMGKTVYRELLPQGTESVGIPLGGFTRGIYLLKIVAGSFNESVPFIVQ